MSAPARQLARSPSGGRRPRPDDPLRVVPSRGGTAAAAAVAPAPRGRREGQEAGRPALRVVPRAVRRRRAGVVLVIVVGTLFALMLGLVAFQARIAQDQLRLDRVETQLREAEARFAQLRLEVARLESPDRIVAEAERLGLERPSPDQIRYVAPSPEMVAEALASGGPAPAPGSPGADAVTDWTVLKPLLNGGT